MHDDSFKRGDLIINLGRDCLEISHPDTMVFTSLSSRYLNCYHQGIIKASQVEDDALPHENLKEYFKNYRQFLGFRHIHLGTLEMAGFLNPEYDLSFGFSTQGVLSQPHLVCDHDSLMNLLLYGKDTAVSTLYQEEYSPSCEILLRELDLHTASLVIAYSRDAEKNISQLLSDQEVINLSPIREKAIRL